MDTAAAIQTIETTYKASADALAVESMLVKLTEKVLFNLFAFFLILNVLFPCFVLKRYSYRNPEIKRIIFCLLQSVAHENLIDGKNIS